MGLGTSQEVPDFKTKLAGDGIVKCSLRCHHRLAEANHDGDLPDGGSAYAGRGNVSWSRQFWRGQSTEGGPGPGSEGEFNCARFGGGFNELQ